MSEENFWKRFELGYPKFKWFITEYFKEDMVLQIEVAAKEKNKPVLLKLLNDVWFYLPDNKFNIMVNPSGWREFLNVIEE